MSASVACAKSLAGARVVIHAMNYVSIEPQAGYAPGVNVHTIQKSRKYTSILKTPYSELRGYTGVLSAKNCLFHSSMCQCHGIGF